MLAFTIAPTNSVWSVNSLAGLNPPVFPSVIFVVRTSGRVKKTSFMSLNFVGVKKSETFLEFSKGLYTDFAGVVRKCKNLDSEGDLLLEAEILEFMKNLKNPEAFPSKKELIDAGRMDLVDGIMRKGGWLSLGWDLDETEEERVRENGVQDWGLVMDKECAIRYRNDLEGDETRSSLTVDSLPNDSLQSASSSPRSLENGVEDESGVEGILSRLEKQRNVTLGFNLRENGDIHHLPSNAGIDDLLPETSADGTAGLQRSSIATLSFAKGVLNDLRGNLGQNRSLSGNDGLSDSLRINSRDSINPDRSFSITDGSRDPPKPETWRSWSIRRAGFQDKDFEAAEFVPHKTSIGDAPDTLRNEACGIREVGGDLNFGEEGISHKQMRSRLQHLELELSSTLRSLRSNAEELMSQKAQESSSDELRKLSDAWEFQENEIMNAKDKLRSTRAKLAVLEGKMALTIIDTQKIVEEKQKRIDDARRTLRLLRTACIVWTNAASEVLLAGSFDGWSTQRKMERLVTGIFSLYLKLYPGRYEIKFIVDGEWRIDPLLPIVNNNGYENNLLIIT